MIFKDVGRTMNIVVFVSGEGGNLNATIELSNENPELINVLAVVSDRLNIKALAVAKNHNIPIIVYEFDYICGKSDYSTNLLTNSKYRLCCEKLHNEILADIVSLERYANSSVDLLVLSYHRIIAGKLYEKYKGKIINQHPADLTVLNSRNERMYVGMNGLKKSILNHEHFTRTSTILIDSRVDTGSILAQGSIVVNFYNKDIHNLNEYLEYHENKQKMVSDWPALKYVLKNISLGCYSILHDRRYDDGSMIVCHKNNLLPFGGISL